MSVTVVEAVGLMLALALLISLGHALLKLLTRLIEEFENKAYPIPEAPPWRVLRTLMEDRGVRQADLLHVFGSRGIASEVVNGKRAISKAQAKALGEFFKVSPLLFI